MSTQDSGPSDAAESTNDGEFAWPLSYVLQVPEQEPGQTIWWSHKLYRGPKNKSPEVFYSKTRDDSEILAQKFLDKPLLGFDMEWPRWKSPKRLQHQIGMIQVASEDMIALFHIGQHSGSTIDQVIAPSLRKIIESPNIIKIGRCIVGADFSRLIKFFGLKPQAAFEIAHLHKLVTSISRGGLADQVQHHFELPLSKDPNDRTCKWHLPLSQSQRDYAAADAYAGFMLYHCMNAKRLAMIPTPPLPPLADSPKPTAEAKGEPKPSKLRQEPLDLVSQALYDELSIRRSALASDENVKLSRIASNPVLERLARQRPTDSKALSKIRGMGEVQQEKFGAEWLEVIAMFLASNNIEESHSETVASEPKPTTNAKSRPARPKQERVALDSTSQALFGELSLRRKQLAGDEGVAAFRIASNATLENIARKRPLDDDALLQIAGIGKVSLEKYGAEWLQVIALFLASNQPEDSQPGNGISLGASVAFLDARSSMLPTTPTRHRRVDEFAEIENSSSPTFGTPPLRTPVLPTGLSFNMAETRLDSEDEDEDEDVDDYEDEEEDEGVDEDEEGNLSDSSSSASVYATPLSRPASQLKRKRSESPVRKRPSPSPPRAPPPPPPEPLTLEMKIFRNKLLAFSKMVATKLTPRPSMPLVTEWTLDRIVCTVPQTKEELKRMPGIDTFLEACERTGRDLLANIHKFAPKR
jgi:ribonuclease D